MGTAGMKCPPVLFLIFNRPDLVQQSFATIRAARPSQLFFAADGPRADREGEAELCDQTRQIVDHVDWPCEVKTLFRNRNLGCEQAVSEAISWFFQHVEQGIILEDDCVASPAFFDYCSVALDVYRNQVNVMHIGGASFLPASTALNARAYCSKLMHCWGWATWRRAWERFDFHMQCSSKVIDRQLRNVYGASCEEQQFWREMFELIRTGALNTWDWRWQRSIWENSGLCIVPRQNLVANVGFDARASHTTHGQHIVCSGMSSDQFLKTDFPLRQDRIADSAVAEKLNLKRPVPVSFPRRVFRRLKVTFSGR